MKYLPAALVLLVLPLAAACGAATDDPPDVASAGTGTASGTPAAATATTTTAASKDPQAAMLAHARCMREHGIDVPDPKPGGGVQVKIDHKTPPEKVEAAMKACDPLLDNVGAKPSPEEVEKHFAEALEFAKCMREHGVDMPDPERDGDRIKVRIGGPGMKIDPAKVDAAQEACQKGDGPFGGAPGAGVTKQASPGSDGGGASVTP